MGSRLLFFDEMVTPRIITFVYWLALLAAVIGGLVTIFSGFGSFFPRLVMGLATMAASILAARIACELLIVLFKIHENIHELGSAGRK